MGAAVRAGPVRRAFSWLFRSRTTGAITVAQVPNVALGVSIAALVVRRIVEPSGWVATAVAVVATGALLWWAIDELARGVNPFRRILGALVLVATVLGIAGR